MNPFTPYETPANSDARCVDFMTMAERELSAVFNAVRQSFGPEQAERSAEEWLHELSEIDGLPSSTREWRSITARVLGRLANRVTGSTLSTQSQMV